MSYATDFVNPLNGKRTWIKLHPDDDLVGLHPNYLTGIGDFDDEDPQDLNVLFKPLVRRAKVDQVLYCGMDYPQSQFVKHLVAKKDRKNCDYVLRIKLPEIYDGEGQEFIQRLLKASGGVTLNTFQDKILSPAVGWSRNYHAYLFIDRMDGALFGPEGTNYGDLAHMPLNGHEFVSDAKYTIANLLGKPGCKLGYLYDLGNQWQHEIIVENIVPCPADSNFLGGLAPVRVKTCKEIAPGTILLPN
ncbi:hypothetical protein EV426DRAFT_577040 [Tirmania nivea]|nr:hypothetical protein EV426DRAFT_577040 [Tirmania nivea]